MQLRNIKNQIRQKVDEAQLNMTPIGLDDAALEEVQSQVLQDEFDLASLTSKLDSFLVGKVDQIASSLDIRTVDQIQDVSGQMKQKLLGLQKQEDEYNRNVQVVVESDET